MLFFFFCCFWAYCRPLLLLLISFCCFWTCCRALIASFYCWILLLLFIVAPPQSHLQLTILTMIIKCGIIKLAHKYKWKLRTISLKNSVYFFLLQPAILTLQLIYDIIKWGLFFLKKNFCSSLIYQLHMLDKIMSRRLQLISVSQLIWKIAAHLYLQLTHLYLQLTYLTAHILDKVPRPVIE